jgi:asparagine synthase (glutamine-hydrolysing)
MCGIFFSNCLSEYESFYTLKHRGPDISVYTQEDSYGSSFTFGFHRLAIIDTKTDITQPFFYKDLVVLCNGEIYNWKELYNEYHLSRTDTLPTDCGIIPLLYEYFKKDFKKMVSSLEGEFAIVLYDKTTRKVYASRDFMGIRPLYYTTHENNVWIASEMKALPPTHKFFHIKPRTIYTFDLVDFSFTKIPYWTFPKSLAYMEYTFSNIPSLDWITNKIYECLEHSVFQRLHTDQPIGCLLSGGIDSSIIAAIASRFRPNIRCFTIGVRGSPDVEAAQKVANFLNVPLTIVDFSIEEGIASIIPVIYHLETYDITTIRASIPQYLLAKWIRKNTDIKVLLSGEGSDELFSGYIYSKLAPNVDELFKDGIRLLKHLYQYDCLRTDRALSAWGIEVRVPFLNKDLVEFVLLLDPEYRLCSKENFKSLNRSLEKGLLRHMIEKFKLLPEEIAKRPKEAFSDAVSASGQVSWYQSIQKWIEPYVFECTEPLKHNPPLTNESKYYREVFHVLFPNQSHILPEYWLPRWTTQTDPSATTLECYEKN